MPVSLPQRNPSATAGAIRKVGGRYTHIRLTPRVAATLKRFGVWRR